MPIILIELEKLRGNERSFKVAEGTSPRACVQTAECVRLSSGGWLLMSWTECAKMTAVLRKLCVTACPHIRVCV